MEKSRKFLNLVTCEVIYETQSLSKVCTIAQTYVSFKSFLKVCLKKIEWRIFYCSMIPLKVIKVIIFI